MDLVTVGHGDEVVTIGNAVLPNDDDPYVGGSLDVTARGSGLSVSRAVFVFAFSGLDVYFAGLAEAWRGWDDVERWRSPEGDLTIEATSDGGSHDRLRLIVQNGPVPTWTASIEIAIEAGAEMAAIARDIERLLLTKPA